MSDIGEYYKDLGVLKRAKKQKNQQASTELLHKKGIKFESFNDGNHLVVSAAGNKIDFWPSTGKYRPRNYKVEYGRGVLNLIKLCKGLENG